MHRPYIRQRAADGQTTSRRLAILDLLRPIARRGIRRQAIYSRGPSLCDWCLRWLRLCFVRRFRFYWRLLHRSFEWFDDNRSKRLADLHILFPLLA